MDIMQIYINSLNIAVPNKIEILKTFDGLSVY